MKHLIDKLERDIVVFDLETTGIDTSVDQIIQFHATRINKKTGKTKELTFVCQPTCAIHPKASQVNGYTIEKLAKEPKFSFFAKRVLDFFKDADVAGYNNNVFDNAILSRQMAENGVKDFLKDRLSFDAFEVYKSDINKKLLGCLEFYCGKIGEGAHDAKNDVAFTVQIINEQIKRKNASPNEIMAKLFEDQKQKQTNELDRYLTKQGDDWVLNFSKNKGIKLSEVDKGFLAWVLKNDFPKCLKDVFNKYLK